MQPPNFRLSVAVFFLACSVVVVGSSPGAQAQTSAAAAGEAPDANDPNENPPILVPPADTTQAKSEPKKAAAAAQKKKKDKPWMFTGVRLSTMVPSVVPIPTGFEGKLGAYVGARLLDVDLDENFAFFLRGKLSGGYASGAAVYQPSFVPFDDKGGLSLVSERYQAGPDLALGLRMGPVETLVDVGVRGGFDVNVARYFGPRVALEARYLFSDSFGIGLLYEFQHTISLGDVSPGWTSTSSGLGLSLSASY